jgi:hypothetical protein
MQAEIDKEVQNYKNKQDPWGDNTPGYEMMLQRQRDIHALSTMFDPDHPERAKGHQLLVLDNTGKHLRAAIGTGDIDGADNVIVNTPGMDTGVTEEIVDTYDEKRNKLESLANLDQAVQSIIQTVSSQKQRRPERA